MLESKAYYEKAKHQDSWGIDVVYPKSVESIIELSKYEGVLLGLKMCKEMFAQGQISSENIYEREVYYRELLDNKMKDLGIDAIAPIQMQKYSDNYLDFNYTGKREICPTEMSAQMEAFILEHYVQYQNKELRMQFSYNHEKGWCFINETNEATGKRNQYLYEGVNEFDCCAPSKVGTYNEDGVRFLFDTSEAIREIPEYFEGDTLAIADEFGEEKIEYLYDSDRDMVIKKELVLVEAYGGYDHIGNQSETELQLHTELTLYYGALIVRM